MFLPKDYIVKASEFEEQMYIFLQWSAALCVTVGVKPGTNTSLPSSRGPTPVEPEIEPSYPIAPQLSSWSEKPASSHRLFVYVCNRLLLSDELIKKGDL
jgi:hypothetical protein